MKKVLMFLLLSSSLCMGMNVKESDAEKQVDKWQKLDLAKFHRVLLELADKNPLTFGKMDEKSKRILAYMQDNKIAEIESQQLDHYEKVYIKATQVRNKKEKRRTNLKKLVKSCTK